MGGGQYCAEPAQWLNAAGRFNGRIMRAETEKVVEEIKRSVGLLRRHL
jgi:hypothetical protein